jgi:hypothetical protein
MMTLEIQHSKNKTPNLKYNNDLGAMMGVCLHLIQTSEPKDDVKECITGDAWFGSARACAALVKKGYKAFLQIKGNIFLYPKDFIEDAMTGMPGGMEIVIKGKHPNEVPLVAVGYRYSSKMTLFFRVTEDTDRLLYIVLMKLLLSN